MKKQINTPNAPKAIGPYSQAVMAGDFLFISGAIPIDPATGDMVENSIQAQAVRVFENLKAILEEAGMTFDNVVKTTVYLSDMANFVPMNEIYAKYFNSEILPARAAFQVAALPKDAMVEIEAVAYKG